ncbi:MAG: hypothetical protein LBL48_11080 [Azoarcus sp.]|jgi:hypothetical protein|nr:hypothetical protein [Azoarcus sp.]
MKFSAIFPLPPLLRRVMLFCAAAVTAASFAWRTAASLRAAQEMAANRSRAAAQTLETRLAHHRETEIRYAALTQRANALAALAAQSPDDTEWERLAKRLAEDTRITGLVLRTQSGPAAFSAPDGLLPFDIRRLRIDADLLHEEALLALDAIAADIPIHLIPAGCALRRETGATPATLRAHCEFDWTASVPPMETPQ